MQYPQQPQVPHREQAPAAAFAPIRSGTRWVFAAIVAVMGLGFGVATIGWTLAIIHSENDPNHRPDDSLLGIGAIGLVVVVFLLYAQVAAALVWVYKAWQWLPWD